MFDGRPAVVLLDPVDLEAVAPVVEAGFQFGGPGFPCRRENKEPRLAGEASGPAQAQVHVGSTSVHGEPGAQRNLLQERLENR